MPLQGRGGDDGYKRRSRCWGHVGWNLAREMRLCQFVAEHVTGHEGRSRVIIVV